MSADVTSEKAEPKPHYEPPKGAQMTGTWGRGRKAIEYAAIAKWIVLRKKEKPAAEIFSVSYIADGGDERRPVTFVFNGGPGAASAYLHMGAVGPKRVDFPPDGTLPTLPPKLVENESSWLAFSDLVFVDPVGTGFSRVVDQNAANEKEKGSGKESKEDAVDPKEYFGYERDLESLCEFMSRWLSEHGRWGSPVFIAGESYGGYRVGRLVKVLQEKTGIGLNGAVLISPALEITGLEPTDYDVLGWVDRVPTMAAAALHHGRSRAFRRGTSLERVLRAAEEFATGEYATFLMRGAATPARERERVLSRLGALVGLRDEIVSRCEGRIGVLTFVRELLREERKVLGLYDATITATDPFPDRGELSWPDPTLAGISPAYTMAVNRMLRQEIGVETEREYALLSYEVFTSWKHDAEHHAFASPPGATDDFRYGMALNPHLKAFLTHGRYDLVTPYYTSDRLRNLMRLDPQTAERVTVEHYGGGHMFYAWESSRHAFSRAIAAFVADACAAS
ncbi:MAG: peptidase S10 [Gaiellaceae bacterium]|jgi:carboxypeptidase C (cathepsin A)|nr:MAG: peptidase S10 [Gaiellaceae bacterium]